MSFTLRPPATQDITSDPFREIRTPDDRVWSTFHHDAGGFLVRFPTLADFWISGDGEEVTCTPLPGTPDGSVRHLYHGQVHGLVQSLRGSLALHASAISCGTKDCVAFCGPSGAGKSTLAASFAREGYPFLTDDVLTLSVHQGVVKAEPCHPALRLWQDSASKLLDDDQPLDEPAHYTRKSRFPTNKALPHCDAARDLRALFLLSSAADISIAPVKQADAVGEVLRQSFLLNTEDPNSLAAHFERLTEVLASVACFRLAYPRDWEQLGRLRSAILDTVSVNC